MATTRRTITDPVELFTLIERTIDPTTTKPLIFSSAAFLRSWWQALGTGSINALVVATDDRVHAIVPSFIFVNDRGRRQLSLIGGVDVADYLDVWIHPEASSKELFAEIETWLGETSQQFDDIHFSSLPDRSPTIAWMKDWATRQRHTVEERQQDVCPVLALPPSWEEYLQSIGKKQRHEMKRKWDKLFREQPASFETITTARPVDIEDFVALHQASSREKQAFWDDAHIAFFRSFFEESSRAGWLTLYFLKIGEQRVATMLGFVIGNQFLLYNSGFAAEEFRSYGVGMVLTAFTIQDAIRLGCKRFDFLRGAEDYKFRFRAIAEPVWDVHVTK